MPKWTEKQKEAIYSDEKGIIVSAAAGSGKTAVLAERISRKACEGIGIKDIVAVTFTRLAAAEIKQRVRSVLQEKYAAERSENLRRALSEIGGAKICTIDSFMTSLVRRNFAAAGISPDFSFIDETEKKAIKSANMDALLEEYYTSYADGFGSLLSTVGGEKDSEKVAESIGSLYDYVQAIPFFETWLDTVLENYNNVKFFTDAACEIFEKELSECKRIYEKILSDGVFEEKEATTVRAENGFLSELISRFKNKEWDSARSLAGSFEFLRGPVCKGDTEKETFKAYRDAFKKILGSEMLKISSEDAKKDLEKLQPGMRCLTVLVKKYHEKNQESYRKLNRFPFEEIAHLALSLAVETYDPKTGEYTQTPLAKELSEKYAEVMIDEYQDTNGLQDLFFTAISDNAKKMFIVGDVKQSIYGFRRAKPVNFMRKAASLHRIDLSENFRSKATILDFANFVCSGLLKPDFYRTEYSEADVLRDGRHKIFEDTYAPDDVEICICGGIKREYDVENEAYFCARKIKSLISSGYRVLDQKEKKLRPARLSDIAVLLPVMQDVSPIYEEVFSRENIPVSVGKKASLFDSAEVNVLIAMLTVVNNPYNNIELAAVMLSEMYAFSEDTLAQIRLEAREAPLFEGIEGYAEKDGKTAEFLRDIKYFRLLSENIPLDRLVWKILTETDFLTKATCREFGYYARENLLRFYAFSKKYASDFSGGLFSFIDFIKRAREENPANEEFIAEGNFVKIMSCHQSKGLEFPICIISDAGKTPKGDNRAPVTINDDVGFATDVRDDDEIYETTTLHREIAKYLNKKDETEEKIRKLYVSLTRARDKLIIVTSVKNPLKLEDFSKRGSSAKDGVSFLFTKDARSMDSFIFSALAYHPDVRGNYGFESSGDGEARPVTVNDAFAEDCRAEEKTVQGEEIRLDIEKIKENMAFSYDKTLSAIPAKISVTELVKNRYAEENDGEMLIAETPTLKTPEFVSLKKDGAFYGRAMHKFMCRANLNNDFETEKKRLCDCGELFEEEIKVLKKEPYDIFRKSDVCEYILGAKRVLREEDFVVSVPASFYDAKADGGEILLQGAMDALCEYPDGFVLIDYKTDRKTEAELIDKYAFQLYLYAVAAEKMFSKKVKKALIWSFHAEKGIDVTPFFPDKG